MSQRAARAALPYRPCAGVVLWDGLGKVFAGERSQIPGAWQMPQGGIDTGEAPRDAALRELEEETAVPASAVRVIAETAEWLTYDLPEAQIGVALKGKYRGQKQHWVLAELVADVEVIDLAAAEDDEFRAWEWITPAEMLMRIVDFKRPVYAQVFAEFAPYLATGAAEAGSAASGSVE